MTTLKLCFRPSSIDGHPGSICYRITHDNHSRLITPGYKIYPAEWDSQKGALIVPKSGLRRQKCLSIQFAIQWDTDNFDKIVSRMQAAHSHFTLDQLIDQLALTPKDDNFIFFMYCATQQLIDRGRYGTAENYRYTLNSLMRFMDSNALAFREVTSALIEDYEAWLTKSGVRPNSISFYMRNLRTIYRKAVEEGLAPDANPFKKVNTRIEKTRKRAISIAEIKKVRDLDLTRCPNYEFARDVFMMQFYCMGISFIDLAYLRKRNHKGNEIVYRRQKTDQEIHVPVSGELQKLLDKYSDPESEYLVPILTSAHKDVRLQYKSALRKVNEHLKEIGRMAKASIPLTTYTTRHSWASIAKTKGIPITVISEALGHDSVTTTEIYLSSIDLHTLSRANTLILRCL